MNSNRIWIVKNLAITGLFMIGQLALTIVMVRLVLAKLGAEGYGQFQLSRQVAYYGAIIITISLTPTLVRALSQTLEEAGRRAAIFIAALGIVAAATIILGAAYILIPGWSAGLIFGEGNPDLGRALMLIWVAQSLQILTFSYFRGVQAMVSANLVQVALYAVIPVYVVWRLDGLEAYEFIRQVSILMIVGHIAILVPVLVREIRRAEVANWGAAVLTEARHLISYGSKRALFPLFYGSIYTFGAVFLNHLGQAGTAGLFLVSLMALRVLEPVFSTPQIVLLPKLSEIHAQKNERGIRRYVTLAIVSVSAIGTFAAGQAIALADPYIGLISGVGNRQVITVARILLLALPFTAFFFLALSAADAISKRPVAAVNSALAAVLNVALCLSLVFGAGLGSKGIALSFVISMAFLSYRLLCFLMAETGAAVNWRDVILGGMLSVVAGFSSYFIYEALPSGLVSALATAVGMTVLYVVLSWAIRLEWLKEPADIISALVLSRRG